MRSIPLEPAKLVITFNNEGNENGWLMELLKDGEKTVSYLTVALPGAFKGYHLHTVRASNYVCVRGKMRIILYFLEIDHWVREEHILEPGGKLHIPKNVATGIENIGEDEGWLVNFPDPYFDPNLEGEQVEYIEEELKQNIIK